jgi:REP element-mobilizing transposase RayT
MTPDGSRHHLVLFTAGKKPLLTGNLRAMVEQGFKTLPRRFPGLKVLEQAIHPDRVEMVLDLHRLDEDLARIVQSFKSEVKNLAKKEGFTQHDLWQWTHEEK